MRNHEDDAAAAFATRGGGTGPGSPRAASRHGPDTSTPDEQVETVRAEQGPCRQPARARADRTVALRRWAGPRAWRRCGQRLRGQVEVVPFRSPTPRAPVPPGSSRPRGRRRPGEGDHRGAPSRYYSKSPPGSARRRTIWSRPPTRSA